jgi:hypothetical protein
MWINDKTHFITLIIFWDKSNEPNYVMITVDNIMLQ